jgi:hypothetical protein
MSEKTISAAHSYVQALMDIKTAADQLRTIHGLEGVADKALAGLLFFHEEHEALVRLRHELDIYKIGHDEAGRDE